MRFFATGVPRGIVHLQAHDPSSSSSLTFALCATTHSSRVSREQEFFSILSI
jgi:hypothetical protein